MTVVIPEQIQEAMKLKGIKNLRQLAIRSGYEKAPMTVHNIFSGRNKHTSLVAMKMVADVLEWTLADFFKVAASNDPEHIGWIIRGRLKKLGLSTYDFAKKLSGTTTSNGGWHDYIAGNIKYDRLDIYNNITTALGITPDAFYESLFNENRLTGQVGMYKLDSTRSVSTYL